ncbi:uncharacterized protein [Anoplolepis gracilipes]|uniref:uncharacterized protein n=1 Tax=Anoplolepis gracilipes TaxID=354296 RepID=UPI003BA239F0
MINAEGVTMRYPQFRLKIDLSKFYHDARQFCWIFIDGTKIQQIIHIQQHISKIFSITEPFHLLLNDTEYLPPTEDVRILKENETIQVVPGSGITNKVDKQGTYHGSMHDKQVHMTDTKIGTVTFDGSALDTSNNTSSTDIQPISNNTTQNMTFYSVIGDTVMDNTEEDTDSKVTNNNNLMENCNVTDSVVKRKRVRKRRPKNQPKTQFILPSNINEESKPKKPRIIDSYIISSGKHIRFDSMKKEENNIAKQIVQEISRNESSISKISSCRDLSKLLALGQSSTPITFVNKKIKNEVNMENGLNDEIKNKLSNKIVENNIITENNSYNKENTQNSENCVYSDLEKLPLMTRKPQVKDIIAFKTLKIGSDYTPQISNFIVTEVIGEVAGSSANSLSYYLRTIEGKEELQVPSGKFSISEDESCTQTTFITNCDSDTFILNYPQMQDIRLVSL